VDSAIRCSSVSCRLPSARSDSSIAVLVATEADATRGSAGHAHHLQIEAVLGIKARMADGVEFPVHRAVFERCDGEFRQGFGAGGGQRVADFAEAPLFDKVPIDSKVREWGDQGTPVVQAAPASAAGQAFATIADELAERIAREHFERAGGETAPEGEGPKRLRILR